MAGEQLAQLFIRILPAGLQNLNGRENKTGRAEAALDRGLLHKCLLNVAQLAVGAQKTLQRADMLAIRPDSQIDAGIECLPIDQDVA